MKQFRNTDYYVSQGGKVFRYSKNKPLKEDISKTGYMRVTLSQNGVTERFLVHRMVAECYLPNINNLPHINHIDNNPENNNVNNLEWCNHSQNMKHSHSQGRCSNLKASNKASEINRKMTYDKYSKLLGDLFIDVQVLNRRSYVLFDCESCATTVRVRVDSSKLKNNNFVCRNCE